MQDKIMLKVMTDCVYAIDNDTNFAYLDWIWQEYDSSVIVQFRPIKK
jgi:hypothetical protein